MSTALGEREISEFLTGPAGLGQDIGMPKLSQVDLMKAAFKYQHAFVSYAYGLLRDWSLAEDAVQEAFLVLMQKWEEFKPELGVYGWARKMVYYKVQEVSRSRRKEHALKDEELETLVQESLDTHLDEAEGRRHDPLLKAYQECMAKLDQNSVELLTRYYWDKLPGEKIAALFKRSVNAVWLSLSRIRKSLRDCISRSKPELEGAP
jgi:RNA polymerase sigma-70 factor (ECF subfamily)